jgi:glutathione S-transferase
MAYKLISSERSPFGRICRMLMVRHGIDFHFRALNFVDDKDDAAALKKETPINKVPILIDGEQTIFDSRVIVNYLSKKHDLPVLTMAEENLVSAIYSCIDTAVILFLMKRDGYDIEGPGFFLQRNRERIPSNLKFIEPWAASLNPENPRDWNYVSISLFSFLYWAEHRVEFLDVKSNPVFTAFMKNFANAPGVKETTF